MSEPLAASTPVVVDANVAIWAILPVSAKVETLYLFTGWRGTGTRVLAPMLWLAECASALRRMVSAGLIPSRRGRTALEDVLALEVEILPMLPRHCLAAFDWAERLGQSRAYDGFYLALAEEHNAEFWTADRGLATAARGAGAGWVRLVT